MFEDSNARSGKNHSGGSRKIEASGFIPTCSAYIDSILTVSIYARIHSQIPKGCGK